MEQSGSQLRLTGSNQALLVKILALVLITMLTLVRLAHGQYTRVDLLSGPAKESKGTVHLYLFDARRTTLKIIDQGGPDDATYENLGQAMVAHRCQAGCNGGPFTAQGEPKGLVIADGMAFGQAGAKTPETSGVLYLDGSRPRLKRASAFFGNGAATPRHLLQAGPFLVEEGAATRELDDRQVARRTFVLTDGNNRWAIGYAPPTTLRELALALADPEVFKPFEVATALNLGGGSPSAIWIKREHSPLYLKEIRPSRNFIGLVQK